MIGSSGSGKSSLVKSGLLPALYSGFLAVGRNWRVALMKPGNDPIGNLSRELSEDGLLYTAGENTLPVQPIIESTLRRSGDGLKQVFEQAHLPRTENLLIVVDQFEELFRFSKYEKQANQGVSDSLHFINLLLNATRNAADDCPVYVLITMRSDFLGDCVQFRGLPEAINNGQYLVPRMTRDEVKEAITGPIAVGGATISQRLLTRLLNDVGNDFDQLPLLQHAMMRTWDAWIERGQLNEPINLEDYLKIGTMSESLSQHANEAYNELNTERKQQICALMFKALTDRAADVRGTRRPRSISDLMTLTEAGKDELVDIINVFRKPGRTFLMPPADVALEESTIIDISHESLMRIWDKLKNWTREEAQDAELFKRMADQSVREKNGQGSLWSDPELSLALKWMARFNNNEERIIIWASVLNKDTALALDFLKRSKERDFALKLKHEAQEKEIERARQRSRRAIFFSIVFVLTALGVIATAYQWLRAEKKAKEASYQASLAKANERKADSLKRIAIFQADSAVRASKRADLEKHWADSLRIKADSFAKLAGVRELKAREQAEIAMNNEVIAKEQRMRAEMERVKANSVAQRSAAARYQKLIRTFATDENILKRNNAENIYKLGAYCDHLDSLRDLLEENEKEGARRINYELYDKLYFSLKALKRRDSAIKVWNLNVSDRRYRWFRSDTVDMGGEYRAFVDLAGGGYRIFIFNGNRPVDTIRNNARIEALVANQKDKLLIWSDANNYLHVSEYNSANRKTKTVQKIPMGGVVTAIGYFPEQDVIYFGLKSGEIGYIAYRKDSRNQPIYRNNLGTRVTAVQYFTENGNGYFFATSYLGKAIVFELGPAKTNSFASEFLVPNKKLNGIELPEYFGIITKTMYDENKKALILASTKSKEKSYLWNPFTDSLLDLLRAQLDKMDKTRMNKIRSEVKFY